MKTEEIKIRIDPQKKRQYKKHCSDIGSDMSTEITKFIYKTLKK